MYRNLFWSLFSALFVISMISFVSCDDKEDSESETTSTASLLVGTWYVDWFDGTYDIDERYVFNSDGTGSWEIRYYYEDTNHLDSKVYVKFTYTLNGSTLAMTSSIDGKTENMTIISISKEKLKLSRSGRGTTEFERR